MVGELMSMEIRFLVEALRAVWVGADERLLSSVDPHMSLQIEVKRESLVAQITFVWFFALNQTERLNTRNEVIDLLCVQACAF